ncbi:stress enhanced protein 1, chloroplastic-like isoform X2 [Lolium rigidum]|uniref:stress enhanced protein 1, chloroplastic-like isoform X2 n=1 Tax=Lolium rigidum TaxID=89674 RepID=UPI001F5E24BF|nr:stress enhanced protein 1, chloroplastic-like isoform X2 [Lolium rigidum]
MALSSAAITFHLTATPGNGVSRLSVTSAGSSARVSRSVRSKSLSVRCEQGSKGGPGLDVWLSRGAMLGFVGAVGVELTTGKGVLQNVGLIAPLPALALGLTGVVGVVTAFLIFQSGSSD